MTGWVMYGLVLPDYSSHPETDGWFSAFVGHVHGRLTVVVAVACNLVAAVSGLISWRLAPTAHLYDLPLYHRFIIALWVVNIARVAWAVRLVGKPARRSPAMYPLAF